MYNVKMLVYIFKYTHIQIHIYIYLFYTHVLGFIFSEKITLKCDSISGFRSKP